ncbi:MAG: globin domain-containing protein [Prochloraceae cyanobacterium]|nr:globin domain-containing protein [Prochloraceae cyanobacterium]
MNIDVLQESLTIIRLRKKEFAATFYENLFAEYPEVKRLFVGTNIKKQETKLMTVFVIVISNLHNITYLKNLLKNLGTRHVKYGVVLKDYDILGDILIKTIKSYLQEKWTVEIEEAWKYAYQTIVNLMLEGATNNNTNHYDDRLPYIPSIVEKLRAEAIAQKYLRDGRSLNLVKHKLKDDYYFKELESQIGTAQTMEIISDVVKRASQKELNYNKVTIS